MLKSSVRTNEVTVMVMEEWAQVIIYENYIIILNIGIRVRQKKPLVKEVVPYAKEKGRKCCRLFET